MSGIVFFRTQNLEAMRGFYEDRVGCELWMDQGDVLIFRHGGFLVGFCDRDSTDREGLVTFFYETREEVDAKHELFADCADDAPKRNERYDIYHFFATDPDGRKVEFQHFESAIPPY